MIDQEEYRQWSEKNFPGSHTMIPMLGMIEEIGEIIELFEHPNPVISLIYDFGKLAHILLKAGQNIRGMSFDKPETIRFIKFWIHEIVQDCMSVLERLDSNLLNGEHLKLGDPYFYSLCGDTESEEWAEKAVRFRKAVEDGLADAGIFYEHANILFGVDTEKNVRNTWEKVKKRNWVDNPVTGNAEPEKQNEEAKAELGNTTTTLPKPE